MRHDRAYLRDTGETTEFERLHFRGTFHRSKNMSGPGLGHVEDMATGPTLTLAHHKSFKQLSYRP